MYPSVNFCVPQRELGVRLSLLPNRHCRLLSLVASKEHQPPFGCPSAPPCSYLCRSRQSRVIEFTHRRADTALAALKLVTDL
jgi:hypothetical protein